MNIALLIVAFMLAIGSLSISKTVPSTISFIGMMFVLALYYFGLDEKLLGLFQIFIYTGGVMVLMLFGITLIGVKHTSSTLKGYSAVSSFLLFITLSGLFLINRDSLVELQIQDIKSTTIFAKSYVDFMIAFALIGSSLLYGTVKMIKVLKRKKNV